MNSKAQITAVAAGDAWLEKGANLLLFRPPGGGKSHLASAIGLAFQPMIVSMRDTRVVTVLLMNAPGRTK